MELKNIDLSQKSFTANGNEYFIESTFSIQRSVYAELAKQELETGMSVGKQTEDWVKVYDLANEQKFADIVVLAYNNRRGFKNFFQNDHPVLKLCACFMNTADEDRRYIDDDIVSKKIHDWNEEGVSMQSFFAVALTFLKNEVEGYKNATQTISDLLADFIKRLSADTEATTTSD